MNLNRKLISILILSTSLTVSLGMAYAQTSNENNGNFAILGGLVPDNSATGPVANVGAEYKFDDGFYQKIQGLILEEPQKGDFGVYDGERYYNVIMVVSRDDGDGRDPDETAKENKASIVRYLNTLGARDIISAESLSFVTASIPVAEILGFSLREEIYQMGDGELSITTEVDAARQTTHATPSDLRQSIGRTLDGTGVVVAVVDTGINSIHLNSKVINRAYCDGGCREQPNEIIMGRNKTDPYHYSTTFASHGTQVAQVLAASGMSNNNGLATGVTLLDAMYSRENGTYSILNGLAHAIDWSYSRGADVVNVSVGHPYLTCGAIAATSYSMIINEAVDKGMVVVDGAGNNGLRNNRAYYQTITSPTCAYNVIAVGGINDRGSEITMYRESSRGPIHDSDPRLAPHIVAPAYNIQTLDFPNNGSMSARSGTSVAAPQASAAAAMLLQVNPELTPAEVKAALLLGATWTGPVPCTSKQYEKNNASDNCSYARQPRDSNTANNAASLKILNNVGFGILNVAESLKYASSTSSYIVSDYYPPVRAIYYLNVTDTSKPVKVLLTWMAHPHGGIAEQRHRGNVPVNDLDFMVVVPGATTFLGASRHQTTEFVVFDPPVAGEYPVIVDFSNSLSRPLLNKPVQAYTLASNAQISKDSSNHPPTARSSTVVVSPAMPMPVRLHAADSDGDAVTFHVSRDPTKGTVTTDELITTTMSRVIYTPDGNFAGTDTFQVTPHDGQTSGTPASITLVGERLPTGTVDVDVSHTRVKEWDSYEITRGFAHAEHSHVFTGRNYPVSALYVSSANMDGVDLKITTNRGTYSMAVPSDGQRMIEFASPVTIQRAALSTDGIAEEASQSNQEATGHHRQIAADYDGVRMMIGYVPGSCTATGPTSCPSQPAYSAATYPEMPIYERTGGSHTSSTIQITETGTITELSVYVDIDHKWIGDLGVYLVSPGGTSVTLHDRSGGSQDDINKTYRSSTSTALAGLVGSGLAGDWTLLVDDYVPGISGTLNGWSIKATYRPGVVSQAQPAQTTVFSDDFELGRGHAVKWVETGAGNWITQFGVLGSTPALTRNGLLNHVLYAENCSAICTVTLRNPIDLTGYSSATLSFWRSITLNSGNDEYLKLELYDGSRWNTVYALPTSGGYDLNWHHESYNLAPYLDTSDFKMRFVTKQNSITGSVNVDDVVIKATSGTGPG